MGVGTRGTWSHSSVVWKQEEVNADVPDPFIQGGTPRLIFVRIMKYKCQAHTRCPINVMSFSLLLKWLMNYFSHQGTCKAKDVAKAVILAWYKWGVVAAGTCRQPEAQNHPWLNIQF